MRYRGKFADRFLGKLGPKNIWGQALWGRLPKFLSWGNDLKSFRRHSYYLKGVWWKTFLVGLMRSYPETISFRYQPSGLFVGLIFMSRIFWLQIFGGRMPTHMSSPENVFELLIWTFAGVIHITLKMSGEKKFWCAVLGVVTSESYFRSIARANGSLFM